ncbi:hypothetical protein CSAL01_04766 [Colletotrichum salicis]|uniref:Uncharacterized protein n=1 Tax=Colletotrichum salicis TaxID=1209931 RepID=A0A135RU34_9PEZI|nr:hypothetical protein CSAL01_04766 [Colletotrichum salicis]
MGRVKAEQPPGNHIPANGRDQQHRGGRERGRGGGQQGRMHRTLALWSARDDYALRRRSPSPRRRFPAPQALGLPLRPPRQPPEDRVLADIAVKWPDATVAVLYDKTQEARDNVYRRLEGQGKVRINKAVGPENRKYPFEHTYEQIHSFDTERARAQEDRAQQGPTATAAPAIARRPMSPVPAAGSYIVGE